MGGKLPTTSDADPVAKYHTPIAFFPSPRMQDVHASRALWGWENRDLFPDHDNPITAILCTSTSLEPIEASRTMPLDFVDLASRIALPASSCREPMSDKV